MTTIDDEIDQTLTAFALRFDGDKYAQARGNPELLPEWSTRFVDTLRMADDPLESHAAFFALQRFLCKWGGETLGDRSREHLAYRLLFLHLYRRRVDPKYRLERGAEKLDRGRVEAVAAAIREQVIVGTVLHGVEALDPNYPRPGPGPSGTGRT